VAFELEMQLIHFKYVHKIVKYTPASENLIRKRKYITLLYAEGIAGWIDGVKQMKY
jgi:hypothetical protein